MSRPVSQQPGVAPLDGVLVVDKPRGITSHDVVARVRRILGTKRVGHVGTLDPMATGVLPLVLERATRLASFLSAGDKVYHAVIRLGVTTDTYDATGTVIDASSRVSGGPIDRAAVETVAKTVYRDIPPDTAAVLCQEDWRCARIPAGAKKDAGHAETSGGRGSRVRHRDGWRTPSLAAASPARPASTCAPSRTTSATPSVSADAWSSFGGSRVGPSHWRTPSRSTVSNSSPTGPPPTLCPSVNSFRTFPASW